MSPSVWLNGSVVDADAALVSVLDHGFTVGDGVFETLGIVTAGDGAAQAVAVGRHLRRLRDATARLGLHVGRTDDELRDAIATVVAAAGAGAGRVRLTVTAGPGPLGPVRGEGPCTVVVWADAGRTTGETVALATLPWRRNEHSALAGVKSTSFAENVLALREARARGADEAILANTAGNLCEGSGSNVFVGMGGRLVTPPLSSGCLPGVTRELLVELVDVDEIDLPLGELYRADEAFITSSTRGVHPVAAVDGTPLPRCPGPLTTAAHDAYAALIASTVDP